MIRDAQKNGLTIDDIAKMFSKTLNAVQQEDQKKKAIVDARTDQFETGVAAALYTLTMAEKYLDELLQALLDKVDAVPKSKDKSDNEKIADFLREIGL